MHNYDSKMSILLLFNGEDLKSFSLNGALLILGCVPPYFFVRSPFKLTIVLYEDYCQ